MSNVARYTPHFTMYEMQCKCPDPCNGKIASMDLKLIMSLEKVRKEFNRPMIVNSGLRCEAWNKKVGGAKNSMHLQGRAVDIKCMNNEERYELVKLAIEHGFKGIGVGNDFVHFDNRNSETRICWAY